MTAVGESGHSAEIVGAVVALRIDDDLHRRVMARMSRPPIAGRSAAPAPECPGKSARARIAQRVTNLTNAERRVFEKLLAKFEANFVNKLMETCARRFQSSHQGT